MDATTVRRTRHFVKKYYPFDRVTGPDGIEVPIQFPTPRVRAITYDFGAALPGFFREFAEALAPDEGRPQLHMARYAPSGYLRRDLTDDERAQLAREVALVGLIRSGLLKRLESSAHAFRETLQRMITNHDAFLEALRLGYIAHPDALAEYEELDDEEFEAALEDGSSEPASEYDVERLREHVEHDRAILSRFLTSADRITHENDPKLARLHQKLIEIARMAEKDGATQEEIRNNRKVIIFSYFEDTVRWIEKYMRNAIATDPKLAAFRERLVVVSGEGSHAGVNRAAAIFGFAPKSSEAPKGLDDDKYDIMLATDVLAEGQNLQQSRNIINYDLPWNPMRLVQRHGRVDRIGSPHKEVFIWCFFPDRELNLLLGLEDGIRRKLAQAAASVGVEAEVIPRGATSERVFGETREEIERLRREDPTLFENAGEDPNAHSGEEYRRELVRGMERWGDKVKSLPWSVGSGFRRGDTAGFLFCAKLGDRTYLRFVTKDQTEIVSDTLKCLRHATCEETTPRRLNEAVLTELYSAWEHARHDIFREWSEATDPAKLQPKVRPLFRQIGEHLREFPPPEVPTHEVDQACEAVEAPWGARLERQLRLVFEDQATRVEKSRKLIAKIRELGLQPFRAPQPLPPIELEDVQLVCWLVVETEADRRVPV